MHSQMVLLGCVALLLASSVAAADPQFSYRWAYRNPLSITNGSAIDLGEGSYNGTVNSTSNQAQPATTVLRYSHGATTAFLPNGSLAVIWQGSPLWWEGNVQQQAYWALSSDDGKTFGPATLIYSSPTGPLWLPNIHVDGSAIYLFFSGTAPPQCQYVGEGGLAWPPGGDLQVVKSLDNGQTWSPPEVIMPAAADGMSAKLNIGRVALDSKGRWLLPIWRERSGPTCWDPAGAAYNGVPGVFQSADKGMTWKLLENVIPPAANTPATQWLIENIIVRYSVPKTNTNALLQTFRSNSSSVWVSRSFDDGTTWTPAAPGPVQAPNTKTDMTELPDGSVIMAYNDATVLRTNLTLIRSTDGGLTWMHLAVLENDTNAAFSYPTVTYHPTTSKVSVVYSVWQMPSNSTAAAFGPTPQRSLAPTASQIAHPNTTASQGSTTAATQTAGRRLSEQSWGRKLLNMHAAEGADHGKLQTAGRTLQQVPFNQGAWGKISYGIRMASIDLNALLGSSAQLPQTGGR